ncbi:GATA zinc finger domain-containing protein 14-like [Diorhabda carinulata]|uniref:GATA zinc finger domain-containing protein 14-like n=1 Tax=Diorhabda carinulata TaxID=1163345 RepID=UPI0025A1D85F|nr:GATA zinc finger domain-containing protein 14-like [Diorhabda carinulata]
MSPKAERKLLFPCTANELRDGAEARVGYLKKVIIIIPVLFIVAFGAKLNQYLPPRPETDNIQFQPPALPNQPIPSSNLPERQFGPSKASEQSGQSKSPFGQFAKKNSPNLGYNQVGQLPKNNVNIAPEQYEQTSNPFGQFSQKNTFNTNNGNPSRQYLPPNNKDTSVQSSNSVGQFQIPSFNSNGYNKEENKGLNPKANSQINSFGQFPNQRQGYNVPAGEFNGQFPAGQSITGPQSAPVGLIRSEFKPDSGDGYYNYLYETENGITAEEEGGEKNDGKSAQGSFSYTSPEGEQITIEYTADANGFVPKGSYVPEIPEAIAKSIELNKAAEARGEYNEGSYRDEYNDDSNGNKGNAQFSSFQGPNAYGYQKSGPTRNNNFADQGTFASEDNKQVSPFGQQSNGISSYDQKINGVPKTLAQQSYRSQTPPGQKGTQQNNKQLQSSLRQQNNGPKTSFGQNYGSNQYSAPVETNIPDQGTFASQQNKQVTPFGQQNNIPSTSFVPYNKAPVTSSGNNNDLRPSGQQYNVPATSFGQQTNVPKTSFEQNNDDINGYQYAAPGKNNFADQGSFASQQSKQVTSFGQQNNVPSTAFGSPNKFPSTSFGNNNNVGTFRPQNEGPKTYGQSNDDINGYEQSAPGNYNFADQGTFASQQNKQITPFGHQNNSPATSFGSQNKAPSTSFEDNVSFKQQNKGPNVNFQYDEPSGQYGTVQDSQGGYKY